MKKFLAGLGEGKRFLVLFGIGLLAIILANTAFKDLLGDGAIYIILNVAGAILIILGVLGLIVKILMGIANGVKKVAGVFGGKKMAKKYGNHSSSVRTDDGTITLVFGGGQEVTFRELDSFMWKGSKYSIMSLAKPFGEMKIGDKVVFRVYKDSNGYDKYSLDIPDNTLNEVFAEYKRRAY
jgi:hypothetical protein